MSTGLGAAALAVAATLTGSAPAAADASADLWVDAQNDYILYRASEGHYDVTLSYSPLQTGPDGATRLTIVLDGADTIWIDPKSPYVRYPDPNDMTRVECTLPDVADEPSVRILFGGTGDDRFTVREGFGHLVVHGGRGNDTLVSHGFGQLYGDEGRDTILDAGEGHGGDGPDTIQAQTVGARAYGDGGSDLVIGGEGGQYLLGGPGDDTIHGRYGDDTVYGGKGEDQLHGGKGDDRLYGEPGNDTLRGDSGDDLLRGGPGADQLFGGSGSNRLIQD